MRRSHLLPVAAFAGIIAGWALLLPVRPRVRDGETTAVAFRDAPAPR
ncbi:MAG: hypothetical protein ACREIU_10985 [Planctomycetota bacterium]